MQGRVMEEAAAAYEKRAICISIVSLLLLVVCSIPPLCLAGEAAAAAQLTTWKCSNNRTYYAAAPNSTYQSNVRGLIASLATNASRSSPVGFATGTIGSAGQQDTVWGVALCRGDTNGTGSASCLALSAPDVAFGKCRGARDVSAFYDRCLLRFSDEDILASPDNTQVQMTGASKDNVTGGRADRFDALVGYLMDALSDLAAFNTTSRYAVGVVTSDEGFPATTEQVVYNISGMVQCTPNQAAADCRRCLQGLMDNMPAATNGCIGGQMNAVWCRLRFEVRKFYDGSPMLRLTAPPQIIPPSSSTDKGKGTGGRGNVATAIAIVLGVVVVLLSVATIYLWRKTRTKRTYLQRQEEPLNSEPLDWHTRYKIIYGVARGLLYLHEDSQAKIIHRDLKASNILLNGDMTPKISDFGLARLFNSDKTTTVTSQVVGTLGYMAPEYAVLGHLSVKLDVYSFGVLTLEIVTGRRNTDVLESGEEEPNTLLSYVWDHWSKGTPLETMNGRLWQRAPESEALRCIHLGLLCVQENPADRPTMLSVLVMLHGEASGFDPPSRPAFAYLPGGGVDSSVAASSGGTADPRVAADHPGSVNGVSVSDFQPR